MKLREYREEDCRELARLFYDTVHTVNGADYTGKQLDAWAPEDIDLASWNQSFLEHHTVVAVRDGIIAGFGDMEDGGYLDSAQRDPRDPDDPAGAVRRSE